MQVTFSLYGYMKCETYVQEFSQKLDHEISKYEIRQRMERSNAGKPTGVEEIPI